jgi:hypothetical protein
MTRREDALPHGSVIARSDQREGRGNPSCLKIRVRGCGSLIGSQWIATGYTLAMTKARVVKIRESDRSPRQCHCEERPTGGTRQSIVSRRTRTAMRFVYRFTVDRHGLTPSR